MSRLAQSLVVALFFGLLGTSAPAWSQGSIVDGDSEWSYDTSTSIFGIADYRPVANTDHLFQQWWYYRVAGASSESNLPYPPLMQNYTGNIATLDFAESDFDAQLVLTLTDGTGANTASVVQTLELANPGTSDLELELFCYVDFDVLSSAGGDSASLVNGNPTHIRVNDGTAYSEVLALGATGYQVATFANIRGMLQDATITTLDNTGLPFGPGDFTGAFQWNVTIPAGGTEEFTVVYTCNEPAVPPVTAPEFIRGDCNDDGSDNLPDVVFLLGFLFPQGGPPNVLNCESACDMNDDGSLNLPDAIALLTALFGMPPVPLPGPSACGTDPSPDMLTCDDFFGC